MASKLSFHGRLDRMVNYFKYSPRWNGLKVAKWAIYDFWAGTYVCTSRSGWIPLSSLETQCIACTFFFTARRLCCRNVFTLFYIFFYEQLFGISVYACNLHKINTPFGPEKCAVFFRNFFDLFILFFIFFSPIQQHRRFFIFFYAAGNPIFNSCLWVFSHWV